MGTLTKTRMVLQHQGGGVYTYDDGVSWNRHTKVILDMDVYEDMGRPNEVTVTVEPDDRLN